MGHRGVSEEASLRRGHLNMMGIVETHQPVEGLGKHVRLSGQQCEDPQVGKSFECLRGRKKVEGSRAGLARGAEWCYLTIPVSACSHLTTLSFLFLIDGFEFLTKPPPSCRKSRLKCLSDEFSQESKREPMWRPEAWDDPRSRNAGGQRVPI